jgi:hypothetical protein
MRPHTQLVNGDIHEGVGIGIFPFVEGDHHVLDSDSIRLATYCIQRLFPHPVVYDDVLDKFRRVAFQNAKAPDQAIVK